MATGTILVLNFFKSYSWVQDRNPMIILWLTSVDDLFEFYGPFIINSISWKVNFWTIAPSLRYKYTLSTKSTTRLTILTLFLRLNVILTLLSRRLIYSGVKWINTTTCITIYVLSSAVIKTCIQCKKPTGYETIIFCVWPIGRQHTTHKLPAISESTYVHRLGNHIDHEGMANTPGD